MDQRLRLRDAENEVVRLESQLGLHKELSAELKGENISLRKYLRKREDQLDKAIKANVRLREALETIIDAHDWDKAETTIGTSLEEDIESARKLLKGDE